MCGIFISLSTKRFVRPDGGTVAFLDRRGPDHSAAIEVKAPVQRAGDSGNAYNVQMLFYSSVLSLRGGEVVAQPVADEALNCLLCWNGEAWSIAGGTVNGNDSEQVFQLFRNACDGLTPSNSDSKHEAMLEALSLIQGPYAFAFYDGPRKRLYYGRDFLGRRSLLSCLSDEGDLLISSVCNHTAGSQWREVEADGLNVVDLSFYVPGVGFACTFVPYIRQSSVNGSRRCMTWPFPPMCKSLPGPDYSRLSLESVAVSDLERVLRESLTPRVSNIPQRHHGDFPNTGPKLAILFSGGLDCTVLARLTHEILPFDESIDLLNVAFENPRVHSSLIASGNTAAIYESCPDRITGRASVAELRRVCPERRWNFVEINIPYAETCAHRARVISLMHPHNTEMDLSISFALYFASRGSGVILNSEDSRPIPYTSPALVLLSGLGADELFGGYQRHSTAFLRHGVPGLIDELELDITRLNKRNLGRDDRVISHWGKEVRFPYLDEYFLAWALSVPVWEKCGFMQNAPENGLNAGQTMENLPKSGGSAGGMEPALEPGKQVLRLLAWKLGMRNVAKEKKRAIQFGARTAKMETSKVKGTQLLS